jgi:hypothetical protein
MTASAFCSALHSAPLGGHKVIIFLVILLILLVASTPAWGYSRAWAIIHREQSV